MAVKFTQGDKSTITLTLTDGNGNAVDITGASFESYFLGPNSITVTISNSAHTPTVPASGTLTVALTAAQTASIEDGAGKEIITKVTFLNGDIMHFHGREVLTVYKAAPEA